jgi:hypothetical protein
MELVTTKQELSKTRTGSMKQRQGEHGGTARTLELTKTRTGKHDITKCTTEYGRIYVAGQPGDVVYLCDEHLLAVPPFCTNLITLLVL